jgi:3-oxoadipate enol-lactonase
MSDKPPKPCSIALFASDIAQLLSELDIASAHVVGLSFGGFVGFQLAVDHPDLVRSLTVVNSAPALPRNSFGDRLLVAWALFVRRLIVHLFGMRTLGRFLSKKLFPRPDQEAHKQTFVDRWAQNDSRAYLAALAAVSRWSVEARLGSIYCPTCVIFGERDFVRRALKRGYMAKLPNADLVVIPDSGHFTPLDASKRFNDAVISFLEKQERARH